MRINYKTIFWIWFFLLLLDILLTIYALHLFPDNIYEKNIVANFFLDKFGLLGIFLKALIMDIPLIYFSLSLTRKVGGLKNKERFTKRIIIIFLAISYSYVFYNNINALFLVKGGWDGINNK